MKRILFFPLMFLLVLSCTKDELVNVEPNMAFSSNSGCQVWTNETIVEDESYFDYVGKIYGNVVGINESEDSRGKFFNLGFIVTENSQNPGLVYALVDPATDTWRRLDECRVNNIAGFWDALSKNDSEDALIIQQGTDKNSVYLFYGNNAKKYLRFRVDQGEVLKVFGNSGTLPGGFNGGSLFFHDSKRADFPPNWIGLKQGKLWNFGSSINNTPALIPVRQNGFNGPDLNNNIKRIVGYWPFNTKRIRIERGNGTIYTLQKERKNGINFYKS